MYEEGSGGGGGDGGDLGDDAAAFAHMLKGLSPAQRAQRAAELRRITVRLAPVGRVEHRPHNPLPPRVLAALALRRGGAGPSVWCVRCCFA